MGDDDTSIRISRGTWQRLHDMKGPGDSFDDVLQDLLNGADSSETVAVES
jgi:predicted CopG family antitoxin